MRLTGRLFVMLVALGLLATVAHANTISYNTSSPVPYSTTDWENTLSFQKFNPALGALRQVELTISADVKCTLTIVNLAASSSKGSAQTDAMVTATDPLGLVSLGPDVYAAKYNYTLASHGQITTGVLTGTGSDSGLWTDADVLAEFTGSGVILIDLSTYTETALLNHGGNGTVTDVTTADATGTVTYDYDPQRFVPEPSSFVALGTAIAAALLGRRRRR